MVILLIVFLWLVSLGLRLISSGIDTIRNINNKVIKSSEGKSDDLVKVNNIASNLAKRFLRLIAITLDVGRYLLTLLLPVVLVVDIVVATMLVSVASGYLLILDEWDGSGISASADGTSDSSSKNGGKSKVVLVGDSRTVQLGLMVFGMEFTMESCPRPKGGSSSTIVNSTPDGDYIYAQGGIGLDWLTDEYNVDRLYNEIKKDPENTAVVFNMGTNDVSGSGAVSNYISYLGEKGKEWVDLGCDVYFLSCNPINETLYKGFTNSDIEAFNNGVKDGMDSKIKYLDSYSELSSYASDTKYFDAEGLHYSKEIYEKIWQYIVDNVKSSPNEEIGDGSLGEEVYQESLKYVGKLPYVYGGASLSDGADCSGFVGALYKKYGHPELLSEHRTAAGLETVGKEIKDINDAKAGDILCFRQNGEGNPSNHVAIYDGKGGMVHEKGTGYDCVHDSSIQSGLYTIRRIE